MKSLCVLPIMTMNQAFKLGLKKDNSTSIHDKHIHDLHNLNPSFMKEIFTERNTCYNLRNISRISLSKPKSNYYGIESTTFMGSKLWQELTNDIKTSSSLATLRKISKLGKIQNATADYANLTLRRLNS